MSHVQIFCFLASYTVALALEVSRLWFRSGIRGMVMLGFVVAGWIAHTAFLYNRAVEAAGSPLSSNRDWLLLAAWVLVMVYFYLACYHPTTHFGVFLLPLVLGLIVAGRFADANTFPHRELAFKVWGVIHGVSIMLAAVMVLFGFAAGLMYLEQADRLKRKRRPYLKLRLPSLEWLQTANSRTMLASMLLLGIAVVSGVVLNLLGARQHGPSVPLNNPVVLGTLAMFGWLLLHVVIGAFYRPIRQGRKVAYLTLVSFIFLLALVVGMFVSAKHGGADEKKGANERFQFENLPGVPESELAWTANFCPGGAFENSPARAPCTYGRRWERSLLIPFPVPKGRLRGAASSCFSRPSGTRNPDSTCVAALWTVVAHSFIADARHRFAGGLS